MEERNRKHKTYHITDGARAGRFLFRGLAPCCCAATVRLASGVSANASQRVVRACFAPPPPAAHPSIEGNWFGVFLRLLRRFCAFCVLPPLGLRLGRLSHPSELPACYRHCRAEPAASHRHSRAGGNPLRLLNQDMDSRLRGNDRVGARLCTDIRHDALGNLGVGAIARALHSYCMGKAE